MIQVDRREVRAPLARVFDCAADVERWPEWLEHYRWVRFLERRADGGVVEMAAWRRFGPVRWPTWWVSEMRIDPDAPVVRYRHVRGITRGMDVEWSFVPGAGDGVAVTITHRWGGPPWPLVGRAAAGLVIGPVFIHAIARRTLAGIGRVAERGGAP
ncbi:MAG TPA: SRPBCC family protein [Gemmatimonadales bacterium]|nr:SRPBCC family protein [Gemmatimonadales bacterium]